MLVSARRVKGGARTTPTNAMSTTPNEPTSDAPREPAEAARSRLLDGALACLGDLGWSELTIADIVRNARVSKRTFYEHFATKDQCMLALYERETRALLEGLAAAVTQAAPGEGRIEIGATFYLGQLQQRPRVVRAMMLEILHMGGEGLAMRRRVMLAFAAFLQAEINTASDGPELSSAAAMMLVGGINELTLQAFEEDRVDRMLELVAPIAELVRRLLPEPVDGASAIDR